LEQVTFAFKLLDRLTKTIQQHQQQSTGQDQIDQDKLQLEDLVHDFVKGWQSSWQQREGTSGTATEAWLPSPEAVFELVQVLEQSNPAGHPSYCYSYSMII